MKNIHQTTTTATGHSASYGKNRGTTWIACDHGTRRSTVICATPSWTGGLARLRKMIKDYGIAIKPEHADLFNTPATAAA